MTNDLTLPNIMYFQIYPYLFVYIYVLLFHLSDLLTTKTAMFVGGSLQSGAATEIGAGPWGSVLLLESRERVVCQGSSVPCRGLPTASCSVCGRVCRAGVAAASKGSRG